MVGVSPFKGRLMDEIPDAEYKVVEHQIAPPLDPSPPWARWRARTAARRTKWGRRGPARRAAPGSAPTRARCARPSGKYPTSQRTGANG
jgi:hypothetical protein